MAAAVAAALVAVAACVCFVRTRDIDLPGFDAYPLIIASRIQTPRDLAGTFTEKLMDGRYRDDFYRPLVNVTLAIDYALWGTRPIGYQLTNAAWFAAALAAGFALARRLLGGPSDAAGRGGAHFRRGLAPEEGDFACSKTGKEPGRDSCAGLIGPLAGVCYLALHPLNFEIVPVVSRRPEMMCFVFAALALRAAVSPGALAGRFSAWSAVFMLLAIASKETALLFPAVIFVAAFTYSPRGSAVRRLAHAAVALAPQVVVVGVMFAARWGVIGGLGGHEYTSVRGALPRYSDTLVRLGELLMYPQPAVRSAWLPWAGMTALGSLVLAGVAAVANGRGVGGRSAGESPGADAVHQVQPSDFDSTGGRGPVRAAIVCVAWLLVIALAYATGLRVAPWYMFIPAAVAATLLAALVELAVLCIAQGRALGRLAGSVAAVSMLAVACSHAWASPLIRGCEEWRSATEASRDFFTRLSRRIEKSAPGATIEAPPVPEWVPANPAGPTIFGGAVMADYSIQAWAELNFPGRKIRVKSNDGIVFPPKPDELVVLLTSQKRGFGRRVLE